MTTDERFEQAGSSLALAFFRLKGDCSLTKQLLDKINGRKNIYMIPATYRDKIIIRFVICGMDPQEKDIEYAWNEIKTVADELFMQIENEKESCANNVQPKDVINDKVNEITENFARHFEIESAEKSKH